MSDPKSSSGGQTTTHDGSSATSAMWSSSFPKGKDPRQQGGGK